MTFTCISFHPRLPHEAPTSFHALLLFERSSSRKLVDSCEEDVAEMRMTKKVDTRMTIQQFNGFILVCRLALGFFGQLLGFSAIYYTGECSNSSVI